jgi:hypothetical protein
MRRAIPEADQHRIDAGTLGRSHRRHERRRALETCRARDARCRRMPAVSRQGNQKMHVMLTVTLVLLEEDTTNLSSVY